MMDSEELQKRALWEADRQREAEEEAKRYRKASISLLSTALGRQWVTLAARRWGLHLCRFRRGETADDARMRDGNAEVIQELIEFLRIADDKPEEEEF